MFGLSNKGFKRKTYLDILESMEKNAKDLFGENINLSERSPLGLFIKVIAYPVSKLWDLTENVYYSAFIDSAEGVQVDRVAKNIAISRQQARKSEGELTVYGIAGTIVPIGFKASTVNDVAFETIESAVIAESGEVTVNIQSVLTGIQGNVLEGTIINILNPISGIDSVNNSGITDHGADIESDFEFKARYDRSLSAGGSSTRESIEAALLDVRGVTDAIVLGNEFHYEVAGIPPKSIAPYVYGGDNEDIAKTILSSKAFGILSFGSISEVVEDSRGNLHTISFSRPTSINVYVRVTLTTNGFFNPDNTNSIKTEIIKYIGGLDEDTTVYRGLGVGRDIVYTKIIGMAHIVDGIDDVVVELSTNNTDWFQSNIVVPALNVSVTDHTKITIS